MAAFGSASLLLDGPNGGVKSDLNGSTVTIGRTRENEIVLLDAAASSKHCELFASEGILWVRDLNSSNGTFVNGRRIDSTPLYDGDILRIGQSQGRVTVLDETGKPLRQVVSRAPVVVVVVSVVVIIAAAGFGLYLWAKHRNEEREHFAEYEQKAQVVLTEGAPCQVVSKLQLDFLEKHDTEILQMDTGRQGHLTDDARAKNDQILTGSRQRAAHVQDIVDRLKKLSSDRQAKIRDLKEFEDDFNDSDLAAAILAVDRVFARQQEISDEFIKAWQDYSTVVKDENDLLAGLLAANNEKKVKELGDKLSARLGSIARTPAQIHDACESNYRETREKGVAQLAKIAL